jgi:hypothetical protein
MTAATTTGSAYPASIETLIPQAQALTIQTGQLPSRNRLMRELKIGAPKATALVEALHDMAAAPAPPADPAATAPPDPDPDPPTTVTDDPGAETADPAGPDSPPAPVAASPQLSVDGHPGTIPTSNGATVPVPGRREPDPVGRSRRPVAWPVLLLAAPAFVAIWSGWVALGGLAGFGVVNPLPGIADGFTINTAITLPIGMEAYAAYALWVWLSGRAPARARRFARWSALLALTVGAAGQVTYHLMAAAGLTTAPWPITTAVACLPVAVLGMGAALAHLLHTNE